MNEPAERGSLDCIFKPRSIAVVGASRKRGTIGREMLGNLVSYGFNGIVFPVNPKADVVHSMKVYHSVLAIPDEVDLAVIVVPRQFVPLVVSDCARKGVKGIVVISAGFREVGEAGRAAEDEILEICRRAGMRMVGPNCMGVVNTHEDISMNATFAPTPPLPGNIAFLSQSGAMGVAILEHARSLNLGYSMFISMGNKADVNAIDLLEYWENDEQTDLILMYLEDFGDSRRFSTVAPRGAHRKPVLCVKSGRTLAGARAAVSHTGALSGLDVAADALFEHTGIIRVTTVEELFDVGMAFATQPLPQGDRVAILTDAGGPAIMATDAIVSSGLKMAEFSDETKEALAEILPEEGSVHNPVDMLGHSDESHYRRAIPLLLADPGVDALITLYVPPVIHDPIEVARAIFDTAEGSEKPVLCCFMAREEIFNGIKDLGVHFPIYEFPEAAARALSLMLKYRRHQEREVGTIPDFDVDSERVREIFAAVREDGRDALSTTEGFEVLDAYGIRCAPWELCATPEAAAAAAEEFGFPVVVKLISHSVSHKSDFGGVVLDLRSADEVREAVATIGGRVEAEDGDVEVEGFLVQSMIRGGKETILGVAIDPVFGPLVMFGMGGIYVEVLKDISFRLAPITDHDATEMLRSIRAWPLLQGVRGESPVHLDTVEEALLRVSKLITDFEEIVEFDVNPFIAHEDLNLCLAVDARIRLRAPGMPESVNRPGSRGPC